MVRPCGRPSLLRLRLLTRAHTGLAVLVLLLEMSSLSTSASSARRGWNDWADSHLNARVRRVLGGFEGLRTVHRNVRDFGAVGDGRAQDRAAIQSAIDNRTGLGAQTLLEVWLPAGTYLTDGPLLLPSYTVLRGDTNATTTVRLGEVGLGALAQKTGLYDTLDRALSMVQVRDLSFDLLTFGVDPYSPEAAACCPAVARFLSGNDTAAAGWCPAVGSCPPLRSQYPVANSPVFFHPANSSLKNDHILFANVRTNNGIWGPGGFPSACGRPANGLFNWAFGPTEQLALLDCHIDRAGRDGLDIAGACDAVTLAGLQISNSQDDCISIHASNVMWYTPVSIAGQPTSPRTGKTLTFNETGEMRDVLVTRCHLWNGSARGIDVIGHLNGLNVTANVIGPTARAGVLLDTTTFVSSTQTGVVAKNLFRDVGRFTNGLLNKCSMVIVTLGACYSFEDNQSKSLSNQGGSFD